MLLSYFCALLVCGIAFAVPEWEHTQAERNRILGPLADDTARIVFNCPALAPSPTIPTSVHALRPADIKHVAAMGDSLTAANGAKAFTVIGVLTEFRGVSWSIGGDKDLSSVVTLPNIIRKYNGGLKGVSTGSGDRNSSGAGFNVAKAGAVSNAMLEQARLLVERMRTTLGQDAFNSEWKLVTFFIGGNDLCDSCKANTQYTTANYKARVKAGLDYLQQNMPRTLVNFVTVLNVAELEDLHEGFKCQSMQNLLCDCGVNKNQREIIRKLNLEYQKVTNELIDSGIYDTRNDFTVVRQPFMEHMKVPSTANGDPDFSYFAPDCFHFSQKGHEAAAVELWNNMMQKVGQKTTVWNLLDTLHCPPAGNGFIYTSKNSA